MLDYPIREEFLNEEGTAGLDRLRRAVLRSFH
jgi:hypothetical protein